MFDFVLIAIVAFIVLRATRHGLSEGFPLATALLVFLPSQLGIQLPDALPEITIQRIILLILVIRWAQAPRTMNPPEVIKLSLVLGLMLGSRVLSSFFSITPGASFKDLLSFALETVVYFHLARHALDSSAVRSATVRAVAIALFFVALIAFIERYAGVSLPLLAVSHFKYCFDGIQSTYPHRILLGYAMAMGTPILFFLIDRAETRAARLAWWFVLTALVATCFLADSRGGWIGMVLAGLLSFTIGSRRTRRRCLMLLVLAVATIMVRPGIRETILSRITDTYAGDSYKAVSYQYRWHLWHVASSEIARSPERTLFGYGGLSTESMDLSQYFRAEEGGTVGKIGFTSWDNNYASDLIEFGAIGLAIEFVAFMTILFQFARQWRRGSISARPFIGAAIISSAVFMFARTNVYIFGEPLKFLFWTCIAVGVSAARLEEESGEALAPAQPESPVKPFLTRA